MAETVRIKIQNSTVGDITAENFSTETTLLAILDLIKTFSTGTRVSADNLDKKTEKHQTKLEKWMQNLFGGAVGGVAGGEVVAGGKAASVAAGIVGPTLKALLPFGDMLIDLVELTPELILVYAAFKAITAVLAVFQAGLNLISRTITSLFSVAGNFTGALFSGKTAMTDYVNALARGTESIPILGFFTKLLAEGITILDSWNKSLIDLSKSGAYFNGSIMNLVESAADAGLSVSEYSRVIKENVSGLATFGSVMAGVDVHKHITKMVMESDALSGQLSDLGISFAQFSEESLKIFPLFGASAKAHGASERDLTKSTIELITQFQAMADLTGKSRDSQEADLAKLTEDAAWQQKMTHMSGEESKNYAMALGEVNSAAGGVYAQLYKLSVLGIPPLTKELQTIIATTPGLSSEFERMTAAVKAGGPALGSKLDAITADMVKTGLAAGQSFETLISATSAGLPVGADIAAAQKELLKNTQAFFTNGQFDENMLKKAMAASREHAQSTEKTSKSMLDFSNIMTKLVDALTEKVIGPLIEAVSPVIDQITRSLRGSATPLNEIVTMLMGIVGEFTSWVKGVDFKKDIMAFIQTIVDTVKFSIKIVQVLGEIVAWTMKNWQTVKDIAVVIAALLLPGFIAIGVIFAAISFALTGAAIALGVVFGIIVMAFYDIYQGIRRIASWFHITMPDVSLSGSTGEMLGNSPTTTATPSNDLTNHFKNKKEDKLAAELNSKNAAAPTENTASLGDVHDTLKSMLETFKNNTDILSSVKENTGASVKPLRLIANNV
jgi:hypothetical protein